MNLDNIGPATKTVALDARTTVEVSGLSLRKLRQLIGSYPQLAVFVAGGRVDVVAILAEGPDMAMAIFSIGVVGSAPRRFWRRWFGPVVSDDLIAAFDSAAAGRQLAALTDIFDLTFKGGERALPFLKGMLVAAPAEPAPDEPLPPSESSPAPSSDS